MDSQLIPQVTAVLRGASLSGPGGARGEFVCEVLVTTLANASLASREVAQRVFADGFLPHFVCNNLAVLVRSEKVLEPLLFLVQNLARRFDSSDDCRFDASSEAALQQLHLFVYLVQDVFRKDDEEGFLTEDVQGHALQALQHLLAAPALKSYFQTLHRKPEDLALLARKLVQCLYNRRMAARALNCLNSLASYSPVEEYHRFCPAKLAHAVLYVLKMAKDAETRKHGYFLLSNLVLNHRCLRVLLANSALFTHAGTDFTNACDGVREEIAVFLGNTCFGLEPDMVPDLLERRVLEVLQIGFDFESLKVVALVLQSFFCFFEKFAGIQDELGAGELEAVLGFANDQDFLDQLAHFDRVFFERASESERNHGHWDVVNAIYSLKLLIGVNPARN